MPVAIALFSGEFSEQEPIAEIMAAAMVVTIPLVALVLIFQNRIVRRPHRRRRQGLAPAAIQHL